jgi:hypothetical protein
MGRVTTLVWTRLPEYETPCDDIFETVFSSGRLILGDSAGGFAEEYVQARTLIARLFARVTGLPAVEPG